MKYVKPSTIITVSRPTDAPFSLISGSRRNLRERRRHRAWPPYPRGQALTGGRPSRNQPARAPPDPPERPVPPGRRPDPGAAALEGRLRRAGRAITAPQGPPAGLLPALSAWAGKRRRRRPAPPPRPRPRSPAPAAASSSGAHFHLLLLTAFVTADRPPYAARCRGRQAKAGESQRALPTVP